MHCCPGVLRALSPVMCCPRPACVVVTSRQTWASDFVALRRRCAASQVQSGAARYNYTHEIKNCNLLGDRRVSITFRESSLTTKKATAAGDGAPPRRPANPWASAAAAQGATAVPAQEHRARRAGDGAMAGAMPASGECGAGAAEANAC